MKTMTYTESRARYAEVLDQVVNDREEIVITRQGHESAVIIALDEYEPSWRPSTSCSPPQTPATCANRSHVTALARASFTTSLSSTRTDHAHHMG